MRRAAQYDRAVGYFRSSVFIVAWSALRDFVLLGGKIRVLCSQVLADRDLEALELGYASRVDEHLASRFLAEVNGLLRDETLREPARILAALVARGTLDLQIAVLRETDLRSAKGRIFHDKLGIFKDQFENVVIFKGSMNETWTGLAADGNLESIDVAATWMGARDLERARYEQAYFEDLWENDYPTVIVRPFPDVAREEFQRAADSDWEGTLERLVAEQDHRPKSDARGRTLHPHQASGLASWRANDRKGILEFATGSGKTFTAVTAIREALVDFENIVLVVVPDIVLFNQWYDELRQTADALQANILRCGASFNNWRKSLRLWTAPGSRRRMVLATAKTAASQDFRQRLTGGQHLMLVADEVHRLGSPHNRAFLDEALFGPRLGLSATPERFGDPVGTVLILSFFRGILEPRYRLQDAVRDGVLSRYFYRPYPISLNEDEAKEWHAASAEISRLQARITNRDGTPGLDARLKRALIQRARIVKHAEAKIPLAVRVLSDVHKLGQRWIVYCEDIAQLETVSRALAAAGIPSIPFHSKMEGDRTETLKWLDRRGGVVVAIKCLDEGVDIPRVTHALILASSKNPREFIQRRGRVLRLHPEKALAHIYDAIVLSPRPTSSIEGRAVDPITVGELARAVEFAQHADNPAAGADLQQIAIDSGIDWRGLVDTGAEDGEEED
ncbi:DEAD/DEAH box helicase family protein [Nannocystis radixulma]|uniref:DEAD/DEAH box helicase family protein n=1 Tax=Nannocystis radixulma TaxID=2995305 RepID=A0ABT5BP77_9BACT|nr:DEAD/DEAH box helicase family protein [Nannocystis radixulma]MDC0675979.1 DEAD/DEAH box helicase family protein [Nannocystis radixulma]